MIYVPVKYAHALFGRLTVLILWQRSRQRQGPSRGIGPYSSSRYQRYRGKVLLFNPRYNRHI
jgi:hypothetical protein